MQRDEIAARAYQKWVTKGQPPGTQLQDWLEAEAELRRLQELRQYSLIERTPAICWSVNAELHVTSCSGAGLAGLNLKPSQIMGRSLFVLFETGDPDFPAIAAHRRALQGESLSLEQPWRGRVYQIHVEPLGGTGQLSSECIAIALDVTERRQAEQRLCQTRDELQRRLQEWTTEMAQASEALQAEVRERCLAARRQAAEHAVTYALAESGTLADAAPRIVQAVCESLGWPVGALWLPDRPANVLRCLEVWQTPEAAVPAFEAALKGLALAPGISLPGRVWASGQPAWVSDVAQVPGSPRAAALAARGLHGAFSFPILFNGGVLGVLEFFSPEIRAPDRDLLEMLGSIGCQIGQFVEHRQVEQVVHEREQELRVARTIQQGLLPRAVPVLAGFDLAGASDPAHETGGDYFDFFPLPDGSRALAVGDASGHGVGAALLIAETRAYLRALSLAHADIQVILTLTNRRFAEDMADYYFVTLFLGRLDPVARTLTYTSAGHPTGYVLDAHGNERAALKSTGWPLGVEAHAQFPTAPPLALQSGDVILLLTDGIIEARSPQGTVFGRDRTLEVVRTNRARPARAIVAALQQAVRDFCQGPPRDDDTTAVVLKVERG